MPAPSMPTARSCASPAVETVTVAPYTVLGWTVPDIDAAVRALAAKVSSSSDSRGWTRTISASGGRPAAPGVAWFKDPDGNTLSVTEERLRTS